MVDNLLVRLQHEKIGLGRGNARKLFLQNRWSAAKHFFSYDLISHYGCVNAIEFSHDGAWLVSGGDDRRVLLWNLEEALEGKGHKRCMAAEHRSNIFCLDTDKSLSKIYSGGNDEQVIVHDSLTGELVDCFQHEEAVNGLSVHPAQPQLFLTAGSDGRLLMYDMRQPAKSEAIMLAGFSYGFHSVQFNPWEARLVVGANQKFGIGLYDVRKPKSTVMRYMSRSSMHARFNSSGTKIVGLRKRLPPVLFNIADPVPVCEFDNPQYYNSCTMKSCCFGGPDENFVFSGSDDFNLYVWRIPEEGDEHTSWVNRAHAVLKGHRSIVNQVRYNPYTQMLASSGVEKMVKLWSDWPFNPELCQINNARKVHTHEDYIRLVIRSDIDTLSRSTAENTQMMAFFDSLVQREIEGLDSDDEHDLDNASSSSTTSVSSPAGDREVGDADQTRGGDMEGGEEEEGVSGFSARCSIGRRSRALIHRISVSLADDLAREDRNIAAAHQNTVRSEMLDTSNESSESSVSLEDESPQFQHNEDDPRNPSNDNVEDNLTSGDALTRHIVNSGFDPTTGRITQTRTSGELLTRRSEGLRSSPEDPIEPGPIPEDPTAPGPSPEDPAEPGPSNARTSNADDLMRGSRQSASSTTDPSNRIAELISQKRGHLIRVAQRRGKRLRDRSAREIKKTIEHAQKVLKMSEPEIKFPSTDESCDEEMIHASSSSPLRRRPLRHCDDIEFSSSGDSDGDEATGARGQRLSVHPRLQYDTTSSSSSDEDYYGNSGSGPVNGRRWRQRRGRTQPPSNSSSHLRLVTDGSETTSPRASASNNCDDRQEADNCNTPSSTPSSPSVTPVPSSSPPFKFASPDNSSPDKCSSPPASSSSPLQESKQMFSGGTGITPLIISSEPGPSSQGDNHRGSESVENEQDPAELNISEFIPKSSGKNNRIKKLRELRMKIAKDELSDAD
eukprot:TRINITY_DN2969_c0_g1_i1.p1 TRINITY_DN2969_c0_g1~~TRINITY_DN2969_c0_g1_i1.p1  ORF type:complete len:951 (-),score=207.47 TRINITY_DN2969_c0_g1_i1:858-3710(-)